MASEGDRATLVEPGTDAVARNIRNFVRFQQEVIVDGDFSVLPELVAPRMVVHRSGNQTLRTLSGEPVPEGSSVIDHERFRQAWRSAVAGHSHHARNVDEIHGTGDFVWARWTIEWTHTGTVHGLPATGRRVRVSETGLIRFDDAGRMAEGWFMSDPLELFAQLGLQVAVRPGADDEGGRTDAP